MTPDLVLHHFGTQAKIARALDLAQPSVFSWFAHGRVPALQQLRIEELTEGALRADPSIPRGYPCPCKEAAHD